MSNDLPFVIIENIFTKQYELHNIAIAKEEW
jgi:hypothetical protein